MVVLALLVASVGSAPSASAHGADGDGGHDHAGGEAGVSAEVLAFIESPALVALREERGDTPELARQLDYHYRFRGMTDYLDRSPAHVAEVMRPGNHSPEALVEVGLELAPSEWQEFRRREGVGASIVEVLRLLTGRAYDEAEERLEGGVDGTPGQRLSTGDLLSGVWLDQMDGGRLKVAVTDASAVNMGQLARLVPGGRSSIEVIEQDLSADELHALKQGVRADLVEAGEESSVGYAYTDTGVKVRICPTRADQALERFRAPDPENIVIGPVENLEIAGGPGTAHSGSGIVAGLDIEGTSDWREEPYDCTWGLNGHTSGYLYLVTAGHCLWANRHDADGGFGVATARQGSTTISASNA